MADTSSGTGSASRELADFLAGLGGVDARLADAAVDCVVDTVGAMVFGAEQPWSQAVIAHAAATGSPCTVIAPGVSPTTPSTTPSTTPAIAALANGTSAHAFELDDVHEEAVGPAAHMLGGFHPTSMSGVFGAAAAAGHLLGFDGERLNHAFGVATSLASGTMEFAASGGMAKRIHAGRPAEGGVTAALLAERGFEGATDGLAGRYGFCRVFTDDPQVARLTDRLGERWMIDEITVKPYAACSDIHPMIEAALALRDGGLDADRIVHIDAAGPTKAATQNSMDGTVSVMAAQYSAEWNIAAALIADPRDPATYAAGRIADPAIAALQARVRSVTADPRFDATYAWKMGGGIRVTLDDGSTLSHEVHGQNGSMHDPLTRAELDAKFHRVTASLTPPGAAGRLRAARRGPARDMVGALRPDPTEPGGTR